jgi:hypothetical protein
MTADQAAQMLVRMMEDNEVPFGVRAKIAQDLLDRAGLVATQVHQIVPITDDPVMRFFEEAFSDPRNLVVNPPSPRDHPAQAIEGYAARDHYPVPDAEPEEILVAELVEDPEPGDATPPKIKRLVDAGAFDRKPGE